MNNVLVEKIVKIVDDKFAENVNVIDFKRENPFTDYFVICDVDSSRQIEAITNEIVKQDKEGELELRAIDGNSSSGWVVLDLYDLVLHIFTKETRAEYELDKLFIKYPQSLKSDV